MSESPLTEPTTSLPSEAEEIATPDAAPLSQSSNAAMLNLKDIAALLGMAGSYSRLRGFADAPGVSEWLGARRDKGKGLRYPPEAVEKFRRILEAQDQKLVTPSTISAWIAGLQEEPATLPEGDNAPMPHLPAVRPPGAMMPADTAPRAVSALEGFAADVAGMRSTVGGAAERLAAMLGGHHAETLAVWDRIAAALEKQNEARTLPAPEPEEPERFLTQEEAARMLRCKPRSVSRYVKPVRPGVWSSQMIQDYMAEARRKAEEVNRRLTGQGEKRALPAPMKMIEAAPAGGTEPKNGEQE